MASHIAAARALFEASKLSGALPTPLVALTRTLLASDIANARTAFAASEMAGFSFIPVAGIPPTTPTPPTAGWRWLLESAKQFASGIRGSVLGFARNAGQWFLALPLPVQAVIVVGAVVVVIGGVYYLYCPRAAARPSPTAAGSATVAPAAPVVVPSSAPAPTVVLYPAALGGVAVCPITTLPVEHPVATPYGDVFESSAILLWLQTHSTCPLTRQPLDASMLRPLRFH
jgi:hypothetical protein